MKKIKKQKVICCYEKPNSFGPREPVIIACKKWNKRQSFKVRISKMVLENFYRVTASDRVFCGYNTVISNNYEGRFHNINVFNYEFIKTADQAHKLALQIKIIMTNPLDYYVLSTPLGGCGIHIVNRREYRERLDNQLETRSAIREVLQNSEKMMLYAEDEWPNVETENIRRSFKTKYPLIYYQSFKYHLEDLYTMDELYDRIKLHDIEIFRKERINSFKIDKDCYDLNEVFDIKDIYMIQRFIKGMRKQYLLVQGIR